MGVIISKNSKPTNSNKVSGKPFHPQERGIKINIKR